MALDATTLETAIKDAIVAPETPDPTSVEKFKTDFLAAVSAEIPEADVAAGSVWAMMATAIGTGVMANIEGVVTGVASGVVSHMVDNVIGVGDPAALDADGKI